MDNPEGKYRGHLLESKNETFVDCAPISPGIESELKEGVPIMIDNCEGLLNAIRQHDPDLIILHIKMGETRHSIY